MTQVTVATWNSGKGGKGDLAKIMDRARLVACQEMSDRSDLYLFAREHGWGAIDGDGKEGKAATPVFFDRSVLTRQKDLIRRISAAQKVDEGTGPDVTKTKWAVGARFALEGYRLPLRFWSVHLVADSSHGDRHALAHDQIERISLLSPKAKGACIVGGDWNTSWDNHLLDPMRQRDWKSNQVAKGGPVHTHGGWTPDQVWARRATVLDMGQIRTGSDHDALWVTYNLK